MMKVLAEFLLKRTAKFTSKGIIVMAPVMLNIWTLVSVLKLSV